MQYRLLIGCHEECNGILESESGDYQASAAGDEVFAVYKTDSQTWPEVIQNQKFQEVVAYSFLLKDAFLNGFSSYGTDFAFQVKEGELWVNVDVYNEYFIQGD